MSLKTLDDEEMAKFIDAVKPFPCIYDLKSEDYIDNTAKEQIWAKIAGQFSTKLHTGGEAAATWNCVRIKFGRLRKIQEQKETSGAAASKPVPWIHWDQLQFLKGKVARRVRGKRGGSGEGTSSNFQIDLCNDDEKTDHDEAFREAKEYFNQLDDESSGEQDLSKSLTEFTGQEVARNKEGTYVVGTTSASTSGASTSSADTYGSSTPMAKIPAKKKSRKKSADEMGPEFDKICDLIKVSNASNKVMDLPPQKKVARGYATLIESILEEMPVAKQHSRGPMILQQLQGFVDDELDL